MRVSDPALRRAIRTFILEQQGWTLEDIQVFDVSLQSNTHHFIARLDFSAARGGGHRLVEGDFSTSFRRIDRVTGLMGRGRVRRRDEELKPDCPGLPPEELLTLETLLENHRLLGSLCDPNDRIA